MMKKFQKCYVVLFQLWSSFFFFKKILLRILLILYCSLYLVFLYLFILFGG